MKGNISKVTGVLAVTVTFACVFSSVSCAQDDDSSRNILKQGLLGAGVGAISAEASGGKAGQGALIGAGTSVIGSALLDALTGPPRSSSRRAAPQADESYYYEDEPEDVYYEEPVQEDSSKKILKQGLVGAGVGAISASASGGKAGQGALIGAGTNVIGNALVDTLTQPTTQRRGRVYKRIPPKTTAKPQVQQQTQQVQQIDDTGVEGTRKKIIRKYDTNGKVVSEEEIYY